MEINKEKVGEAVNRVCYEAVDIAFNGSMTYLAAMAVRGVANTVTTEPVANGMALLTLLVIPLSEVVHPRSIPNMVFGIRRR